MRFSPILFFCLLLSPLFGDAPWGKDADLVYFKQVAEKPTEEFSFLRRIASNMILFHQEVISPIDGPRSHFFPSSSQYTKEAIQKYGFLKGFVLGCDRLMRENDDAWVYQTCSSPDGKRLKVNLVP